MESPRRLNRPFVLAAAGLSALACAGASAAGAPPHRIPGAGPQSGKPRAATVEPARLLVRFAKPSGAAAAVTAAKDTPVGALPGGVEVVGLQSGETVAAKVRQYRGRRDVVYAEPNAVVRASGLVPNDPSFKDQWALAQIHAPDGWALFPGVFGPVAATPPVAVLDTGVDSTDVDLAAADTTDGANCINVLGACLAGPALDNDPIGHGTHVAGIVGALANNGEGVAGLAFASPVIPVKVLRADEGGTVASVSNGIRWAAGHGARVINLSLSTTAFSQTLCDAVAAAVGQGSLVVAAAGNAASPTEMGTEAPTYPAACPGAVGVAMTGDDDLSSLMSNVGFPNVFVSAPGVRIFSTFPKNRYGPLTGSSSSAALVSGLAALILGEHPERTVADVKRVLARTSTKVDPRISYGADPFQTCATCTWFSWYGYGRIDVAQALKGPLPLVSAVTPSSGPVGTAVTVDGQDFTGATDVSFGGTPAPFSLASSGRLTTTVPEGAALGKVTVTTPGGTGSSPSAFAPVPTFTPAHGRSGTLVTIAGPKLGDATAVHVNGVGASFGVLGPTRLLARIGDAVTSGPLTVTTPEGTYTAAGGFAVDPTILRFSPANGLTGSTTVTVLGKSFSGVQSVRLGGVPASFKVLGPNALTLTVPEAALTGKIAVGGAVSAASFVVNPRIDAVTPTAAPVGAPVTITGSGFGPASAVTIGGAAASLDSVSPNEIRTTVPLRAKKGPISVVADGEASTALDFLVPPRITGFTTAAAVDGVVQVTGTSLDQATSVTLGTTPVTIQPVSSTELDFTVPENAADGALTVTTPSGSFTTAGSLTVLPRVTGFSPASAQTGVTLTVAGTTLAAATSVTIGGVDATITGTSPLSVTVPETAVSGPVKVTTPAGTSTSADSFAVLPHVTGFAPAAGAVGATVTIDGSGFGGATDVRFGGVSASFTPLSVNRLTAVVPDGAAGGPVTVVTPAGSNASTADFTVQPALTDVSPASGSEGTAVTLTGTSLGLVLGVDFGGVPATAFTHVSPTELATTVPPGAASGRVHVTTLAATFASPGDFAVTPAVTSIDPTSARAGDPVTVHGTTLGGATAVTVGGVDAAFKDVQATSIEVTVPAAAVSGQIVVTTPVGTATSPGSLSVLPRVSGFDPTAGPAGTTVTIDGSGLDGATAVSFGGVAATTFTSAPNRVTAVVPDGAAGGPVTVTTPAGSDSSAGSFTVLAVTALDPTSGIAGTPVTITGTGLTDASAVAFDGVAAPVVDSTATTLSTTVPADATTGHVAVTTPTGTATSAGTFTVLPHVSGFDPASGPVGTTLTIDGSGFGGATGVQVGGAAATFTKVSVKQVTAVVPSSAADGPVVVTTPAGSDITSGSFTVEPALTSFAPGSGPEGSTVTLTGTSLDLVDHVDFGGTDATFTKDSATQITATVPAGAATGRIHVRRGDSSFAGATDFTVTASIASFTPTSGTAGTKVTIAGAHLEGATTVSFHGATTAVESAAAGSATAFVPDTATSGMLTVSTPAGDVTSADSFTVLPHVASFAPASGAVGATVTIDGSGFEDVTGVRFGGTSATTFATVSVNQVTAVVPAGAASGAITVVTGAGSDTSADSFTVVVPTIASFTPASGVAGTQVTIAGTNLDGATDVKFNGVAAQVLDSSATSVTAAVPDDATTGPVSVTAAAGTATSADSFTVLPHVSSFTPASGAVGATVTIDGSGFGGVSAVRFAGTDTTFTPVSVKELTAVVPPGAVSGPITVVTPAGSDTSADSFTVVVPTISSLAPTSGAAGTPVTITGTNLDGATAVSFNGADAPVLDQTATSVATTVPPAATTGPVSVTTAAGTATSAGSFQVAATVTTLTPDSGHPGTLVTIAGTGFDTVTGVTFGSAPGAVVTSSATQVTATVPDGATTGTVTVATLADGTAASPDPFTVVPAIASFDPTHGVAGDTVTIAGAGLAGTTAVAFNGTAATIGTPTATSVTATVPAGATTGPIKVTAGAASDTSTVAFTIDAESSGSGGR